MVHILSYCNCDSFCFFFTAFENISLLPDSLRQHILELLWFLPFLTNQHFAQVISLWKASVFSDHLVVSFLHRLCFRYALFLDLDTGFRSIVLPNNLFNSRYLRECEDKDVQPQFVCENLISFVLSLCIGKFTVCTP